jgi:hypothetical protein
VNAHELWTLRFDSVHVGFVPDLFKGATDDQVRQRPNGVNSIAWLVWHLTRVQDAVLSRFVAERAQVLDEGDWNRAMGLDRRDVGPGMTGADVDALSRAIDTTALQAYHRAVADRTRALAAGLAPAAWDEVVTPDLVRHAVAEDRLLIEAGGWVGDFWAKGLTRGWFLLQVGLLHPYGHCFDAMVTRGLLGLPEN